MDARVKCLAADHASADRLAVARRAPLRGIAPFFREHDLTQVHRDALLAVALQACGYDIILTASGALVG